jgi:hypothetical protein
MFPIEQGENRVVSFSETADLQAKTVKSVSAVKRKTE